MTTRAAPSPPGWDRAAGAVALHDAAAARTADEAVVEAGDSWRALMRRAAGHLARATIELAGGGYGRRIVVVVGRGDNGGDGWAAARLLRQAGAGVTVAAPLGRTIGGSESMQWFRSDWIGHQGRTHEGVDGLSELLRDADVVVDAMLGTGARGPVVGELGDAIEAIRIAGRPTVACDVPTGVDADTGTVAGPAVRAQVTVTFGGVKRGLVLHPGAQHVGRLVVADLGERHRVADSGWSALTASGATPSTLAPDLEKRTRGVALAVVGGAGTSGAAGLCAMGLHAGGAGLVTVATPSSVAGVVAGHVPFAMTRALPSADLVAPDAIRLLEDVATFDVVVAGPGLGPTPGTRAVVDHLRQQARRLVLDADALNVHRHDIDALADHDGVLVITPHDRELARLVGEDIAGEDRARAIVELAARLDATVVAKGPGTIVAAADGRVWVTPVGDATLATGGTGDVLAGMVAAAVATARDIPAAVAAAVWQHGFAGQRAGQPTVQRVGADTLARSVPAALHALARLAVRRPAWPFDGGPDELELA